MATVDKLVTTLRMEAASQLLPAATVPGLQAQALTDPEGRDASRVRRLHDAVAVPHHWSSLSRPEQEWQRTLSDPDRRHLIAVVDGSDVGWACLRLHGPGDVQVESFGLSPTAFGQGLGGAFLTEALRDAWRLLQTDPPPAGAAARVWLRTSSWDHPHALANYRARGLVVARRELRRWQPGDPRPQLVPVDETPARLVRPAVVVDAPAVTSLLHVVGSSTPARATGSSPPVATVRERLERLAASRDDVIAVAATAAGSIVGVIEAHVVPSPADPAAGALLVTAPCLDPATAGQGVEADLAAFIEHVARARGLQRSEAASGP